MPPQPRPCSADLRGCSLDQSRTWPPSTPRIREDGLAGADRQTRLRMRLELGAKRFGLSARFDPDLRPHDLAALGVARHVARRACAELPGVAHAQMLPLRRRRG